jgi:uncharacterized protein (UPF0332 family)
MPVEGADFLRFAEGIIDNDDEISYRCSTSRAYYGVFHIARKLLDFSENTTHGEVIEAVKSDNWTLGTKLEDLFKKRKNADYKLSRTNFDKPYAYYHIEECKDVVRKIKKLYTKID